MGPTVDGSEVVGPCLERGATVALRLTVPLKPLVPIILTVKVAELPLVTDCDDGVTVSVKSGLGAGLTLTVT